jgi:hypothetical protein
MTAVGAEQPKIKPTRHPRAGVQNLSVQVRNGAFSAKLK